MVFESAKRGLNRLNGQIDLIKGPRMFLPDPRTEVVVRRILDSRTVDLLYPGNDEAQSVNEDYRRESDRLAPGEYLETRDRAAMRGFADDYDRRRLGEEYPSETSSRTTAHVPPRTIVLDNKYEGAVGVNIWPGYAVMVTNRTGERRVEVGPKMILLDYDETLMPMELSSGKPKTTDRVVRTVYLRTANNQVSDIVTVETRDLVSVEIKISLRANFEDNSSNERLRWFDVENYVKLMTDHVRSRLRRAAKRHGIQEFYRDTIDIVRDAILGEPQADGAQRPRLLFNECGLRVHDVEILQVNIRDTGVASLLLEAQTRARTGAIQLSQQQDDSDRLQLIEALNRTNIDARHETEVHQASRGAERAAIELTAKLEKSVQICTSNSTSRLSMTSCWTQTDNVLINSVSSKQHKTKLS
jgi:major vault protein